MPLAEPDLGRELAERLEDLARQPVLLVATDYDGTLAEIVPDPSAARPCREAVVALGNLAQLPDTHVAIVSGRALDELARLSGPPRDAHLVGSHGSEFDPGFAEEMTAESARLLETLRSELETLAGEHEGLSLETKPAGVALHYRRAPRAVAERARARAERLAARHPGATLRHGKEVVELAVVSADKGRALDRLRARLGASAAVFLGDDATDEDAFRTLTGPDLGVKVGPGESLAPHRLRGPADVAVLLARLFERRAAWLAGAGAVPIQSLSLLSDQRAVALVGPTARVSWLCAPRVDSPPILAELVGGETAGYLACEPSDEGERPTQRYLEGSLVLETRWPSLAVKDYLDCSNGRPRRRAGRTDFVRVLSGRGRARIEFAPRLDFGRRPTRLVRRADGLQLQGTPDPIVLVSPGVAWELVSGGNHDTARAEVDLDAGPVVLELRYGTARLEAFEAGELERRLGTMAHWSEWLDRLELPDRYTQAVRASALALRGLHYAPTGAFAAAATTSLPETPGGVRNWDYRFSWLRDSALAARALAALGSTDEALAFLDWVLGVVERSGTPECLRPLYTVTGHEVWAEAEIAELAGYAGSRPVRIGNGAGQQVQLDVFGPIVALIADLVGREAPISGEHWRLVRACVEAVAARWREPDHGIWEIRKPERHHVHSKTMCWVTVDRALGIAPHFEGSQPAEWIDLAREIRADVLARGWNESRSAFTAAYGAEDLDAAALQTGLSGLLDPQDPRFTATVRAVERELRDGPVVYRYRADDGLPGAEGGFLLCTSWLVEAYRLTGRHGDARELFESLLELAGPTGLLPEEWCPRRGLALGNHPQAYSHIGVIQNALALARDDPAAG